MASAIRGGVRLGAVVRARPIATGVVGFGAAAGLAFAVLFTPAGLDPRDVVRWCREPPFRAALAVAQALLAGPIVARIWRSPGASLLRTAPIAERWLAGVHVAIGLLFAWPATAIFARGGGSGRRSRRR